MYLPKRRKKPKMGLREAPQIRCPGHLKWIRGYPCSIQCMGPVLSEAYLMDSVLRMRGPDHECSGKIEAAHVRSGTDGGTALKPGDNFTIPLCSAAHREQHQIGEAAFEKRYGINMREIADKLWQLSPHGRRWRMGRAA